MARRASGTVGAVVTAMGLALLAAACAVDHHPPAASSRGPEAPEADGGPGSAPRLEIFDLPGVGEVRLRVHCAAVPLLQIASYTTGAEQLTFVVGCLVGTGAGLAFVAPLATVPAAVGPLANTAAGAGATAVAVGEAWSLDTLLGGSRARVMRRVVTSFDPAVELRAALGRFLKARPASGGVTGGELEAAVAGYGFQTSLPGEACCFLDVRTILRVGDGAPREDRVLLGWGSAGADLPPAHCTTLKRFLARDGRLARQALLESTEIAAAVIARRLKG